MNDHFLKAFPTDKEREERVGRFFENQLLPKLNELEHNCFDLEIGCGHGHWLTDFAIAEKKRFLVGVDLITKRVEKANLKMEKRNLNNLLFLKAEAKEFLSLIPESISIHNTYMMFPDPWPKFKHHKRRLIQQSFLSLLASKTLPKGKFFFRTDYNPYFEWTAQHLNESTDWTLVSDTLPYEHASYFQDLLPEFQSLSASRHISFHKGV